MKTYVATIQIEFEADSTAEACDTVSAIFTESLQSEGVINGWCYLKVGEIYVPPSEDCKLIL